VVAIFWRTIKDRLTSLIIFVVIGAFLVWLYASMFPGIQSQGAKLQELMDAYPPELMKAFGIESPGLAFSKFENFLAMEQYSFTWPILVISLLVGWGGAAIAGEVEKGTIELLLSQPISRTKIFFGKYLSGLFALAVFVLVSVYIAVPLAAAYGFDYSLSNYHKMALVGFLFGWSILSLAMFASTLFAEKGRVYFVSISIILGMYVLNLVANLKDNFGDLKYFSFFHYFDANAALMDNRVDSLTLLVFGSTIILFTALGGLCFAKRDIST
jgi:ABC-2 type transport system permease protein